MSKNNQKFQKCEKTDRNIKKPRKILKNVEKTGEKY